MVDADVDDHRDVACYPRARVSHVTPRPSHTAHTRQTHPYSAYLTPPTPAQRKATERKANCDVTRGTCYPRTCVSHVTLGRLCHMLLRGAHGTRGRYPFLCARHEAFLVQNLSQRCCCCAMTSKGITEEQRHDRGEVHCLPCQSSRSLQRESRYWSSRSSVGDFPSLRHFDALAGLSSSVQTLFGPVPCCLAAREAKNIVRRMCSRAVSASISESFSMEVARNMVGFSALPVSRTSEMVTRAI